MRTLNSWRKRHFLWTDSIGVLLLLSVLITVVHFTGIWDTVYKHIGDNLVTLYWTTASVSGALIGFSMTITVIALNLWQTDWFDLIKLDEKATLEIWKTLRQTTWWLVFLTVTALICVLIGDSVEASKWTLVLFLIGLSLASVRLVRAIALIHKMTEIAIAGMRSSSPRENET